MRSTLEAAGKTHGILKKVQEGSRRFHLSALAARLVQPPRRARQLLAQLSVLLFAFCNSVARCLSALVRDYVSFCEVLCFWSFSVRLRVERSTAQHKSGGYVDG